MSESLLRLQEAASRSARARAPARTLDLSWTTLSIAAALFDCAVVIASALAVGALYYAAALDSTPPFWGLLGWAGSVSLALAVVSTLRGDYRLETYLRAPRNPLDLGLSWTIAMGAVVVAMFLLKSSVDISRGATIGLFIVGFPALLVTRVAGRSLFAWLHEDGMIRLRRVLVVGSNWEDWPTGADPMGDAFGVEIRRFAIDGLADPLAETLSEARRLSPDRIVLRFPLEQMAMVDRLTEALLVVPAAISVAPEGSRAFSLRAAVGDSFGIPLNRAPLEPAELLVKRAMDIAIAAILLVALAPLLLLVGLAIRLDSRGPALFRQTRYGFNQRTFRIFKFRTMSVMEDGAAFRQARRGDPRVTRIGHFLRRTNIDELPQLLNVLRGEMSIVGPRPHPVALDDSFDKRIARYARRHAVRPGITGWAQVHGLRGETDTPEKMQARIAYDLAYLDRWSVGLDIQIILMTAFSRRAYRNAG